MAKSPKSSTPIAEEKRTADTANVCLICGDDEFSVKQRARALFNSWTASHPDWESESIDASASNASEALKAIAQLREALDTLPFFGGGKLVWLQNCSFIAEDRTSSSSAVEESCLALAESLTSFDWSKVRLLVSASKPDKRRKLFRTLDAIGAVEWFQALAADSNDWAVQAEQHASALLRQLGLSIDEDALGELVARIGPNRRLLANEIEKLSLYAGDRKQLELADVETIISLQKHAQAFALGEAVGDRNLGKALRRLDEELWSLRTDKRSSEILILYNLISKIRTLLLAKELRSQGLLQAPRDYFSFKTQFASLPQVLQQGERRTNPLATHPYVLYQACKQVGNFEKSELINAMSVLLRANRDLVSSDADKKGVLQRVLLQILGSKTPSAARSTPRSASAR